MSAVDALPYRQDNDRIFNDLFRERSDQDL